VEEKTERPVLVGLVALVGVAVVVGLLLGAVTIVGTRVLGLGGDDPAGRSTASDSLYLPVPEQTTGSTGPAVTLQPGEEEGSAKPGKSPSEKATSKEEITLQAGQTTVSTMGRIDLSGVYPKGEGAILQVQRNEDGAWSDFPVTASVGDGTFATWVQSAQQGVNEFRVVDTDTDAKSNVVKVRIG
jgi:hypothetical protein